MTSNLNARLGETDAQISARFKTTPLAKPRPDQHRSYDYGNFSVKVQFMDGKSVYERYSTKALKTKIGPDDITEILGA